MLCLDNSVLAKFARPDPDPNVISYRLYTIWGTVIELPVLRGVNLFNQNTWIDSMVKTIKVSEEYHEWITAHKREDETMEETLRRMTRGPHPNDVAGLLTEEAAEGAKEAVEGLRGRDRNRLDGSPTPPPNRY